MGWSHSVRREGRISGTDPEIIFQAVEMIKISELPCYFRGVCADPYQNGCKDDAMYYKPRVCTDNPDEPEFLCELCFLALIEQGGINADDWEMIEE